MFHICWTMDCESSHPNIADVDLGENAIRGFAEILESQGARGTFFLIPEEVRPFASLLAGLHARGHEIGLHVHPQSSGYRSDYLGAYSRAEQEEIFRRAGGEFESVLGFRPQSCRPGYCSANDATFPLLSELGYRQTSASMPGRRMTSLASNWSGAPLFAHYANPVNRFLEGGLDLVEIPISVDWESQIWGGLHCQDLRVEFTDAKNHSFLIEKVMNRQVSETLPLRCLVILTHNLFRYADQGDFRRQTMLGMLAAITRSAQKLGVEAAGTTIATAANAYRAAAARA